MFHSPGVNAPSKARQRALSLNPPQPKAAISDLQGSGPACPSLTATEPRTWKMMVKG